MKLRSFRGAVVVVMVLCFAVVAIAFFGAPELGSAYIGLFLGSAGSTAAALPRLTAEVAIPLLRIAASDAHQRPVTAAWVAAVWALLLLAPVLVATWVMFASSLEHAMARFLLGVVYELVLISFVLVVVVIGLALPFACL